MSKAKWRWYRDVDEAVLKVDMSKIERVAEVHAGLGHHVYYMYRCYRNGERCQVSSDTLSTLRRTR